MRGNLMMAAALAASSPAAAQVGVAEQSIDALQAMLRTG